jgi:hypothetical protein
MGGKPNRTGWVRNIKSHPAPLLGGKMAEDRGQRAEGRRQVEESEWWVVKRVKGEGVKGGQ